jgi:hypothetical protein
MDDRSDDSRRMRAYLAGRMTAMELVCKPLTMNVAPPPTPRRGSRSTHLSMRPQNKSRRSYIGRST